MNFDTVCVVSAQTLRLTEKEIIFHKENNMNICISKDAIVPKSTMFENKIRCYFLNPHLQQKYADRELKKPHICSSVPGSALVPRYRKERSGRRGFTVSSHSCGTYFLPTSDFSTTSINFSGRGSKLTICSRPCYATEDRCQQCDLYYYYYYYCSK